MMEKARYDEMVKNINALDKEVILGKKKVLLFGHCNATLEVIDYLNTKGIEPIAILDNSEEKYGLEYRGVKVYCPKQINDLAGEHADTDSVVLIASRFYSAMAEQLRNIGYQGAVRKVIDYNTFAEYSLSQETISRMQAREKNGEKMLAEFSKKYESYFKVFCPFDALGDVYFALSYWDAFAKQRNIERVAFFVPSKVLADVVYMFGDYPVEVYEQKNLDAMIQAVIYTQDANAFIAHQDRPYVIDLAKALQIKCIPLEQIYCCGVYGLPIETKPAKPRTDLPIYKELDSIPAGKAVVLSPYAKSVIAIDDNVWKTAVDFYNNAGYKCYTNVVGDEKPLEGTEAISPSLFEMKSVVERAGTFVGIRSGLCDILREAKAKKIALYPDYNYGNTKWKAIDMYRINQFDYNLLAVETIEWENLL